MNFHQNLQDITEDQLSLASIHYMRSHYQEAIDIYKRILLDNRSVPFYSTQNLILFFFFLETVWLRTQYGFDLLSPWVQMCLANNLATLRTPYSPDQDFSTFISLSPFQRAFLDFFSPATFS